MESKIITILNDFVFLEVYDPVNKIYEYYLKYGTNDFEYKFGVLDRFSDTQLHSLVVNGYFD